MAIRWTVFAWNSYAWCGSMEDGRGEANRVAAVPTSPSRGRLSPASASMPPVNEITSERRISFGCPRCSYPAHNLVAIIHTHADGRKTWTLYPWFPAGRKKRPPAIRSKRCPTSTCTNVFRVSAAQLEEMVWAGGRAE